MQRDEEFETVSNQPLESPQSEFGDFRDLPLINPYYSTQN